jgi:hypothetical protein
VAYFYSGQLAHILSGVDIMGMREFIDEAGAGHFRQEVVVAAAAWKVQPGEERSHAAPAS